MLQYDPNNRASAENLLKHDFLTKNCNEFSKFNKKTSSFEIQGNNLIIDFNRPIRNNIKFSSIIDFHNQILDEYNRNYHLIKEIGGGNFGKVYLTQIQNQRNIFYATKVIDIKQYNLPQYEEYFKYLNSEIEILKRIDNKYIIHMHDYLKTKYYYYITMEYCNGENLENLLTNYKSNNKEPFPPKLIQYFMRQIIEGIKYLHSLHIIHRDIKLDNILVNFKSENHDLLSSEIKIIDFGLSKQLTSSTSLANSIRGNMQNMDPVLLEQYYKGNTDIYINGYNEKSDIWSLGAICYKMLTGNPLFVEFPSFIGKKKYTIPLDLAISNEFISFITSMLQYDPENRASAEELLKCDFLIKKDYELTQFNSANSPNVTKDKKNLKLDINHPFILNYKKYIEDLLEDYKLSSLYFESNGLEAKKKDADNECSKLNDYLSNKDIKKLPNKIIPKYIYDCSSEVRKKTILLIIRKYKKRKLNLEKEIKKSRYDNKIKYDIFNLDNKIKEYEKIYADKWAPPPEIIYPHRASNEGYKIFFQVGKINREIDKGNVNSTICIKSGRKELYKQNFRLILEKEFKENWTWNFSIKDWKNYDINSEGFIMEVQSDSKFGGNIQTINIEKIKIEKTLSIDLKIPGESGKAVSINFSLTQIPPKISSGKTSILQSTDSSNSSKNGDNVDEEFIVSTKKAFPSNKLKIK